tara:strand:+ start:1360 stop:1974 length:615 start_codon:yes stop_codon:yes gene_type:complete
MTLTNLKKAAMFGLDARIALAIFGALSVISGAALYSAIQQAKVTAIIAQMNEVGKAWEQLYLDTGRELPIYESSPYLLKVNEFLEDIGTPGWNGPYLSLESNADWRLLAPGGSGYSSIEFRVATGDTTWLVADSPGVTGKNSECKAGVQCNLWIRVFGLSESLVTAIDERIDGTVGKTTGNLRAQDGSGNPIYYKYANITNPFN